MSAPNPGDRVLYVADPSHWNELDAARRPLFVFAYANDGPLQADGSPSYPAGEILRDWKLLERVERELEPGRLRLNDGREVLVLRPCASWPATVSEQVQSVPRDVRAVVEGREQVVTVHDLMKSLLLDVAHPNGFITLHLPLEGPHALPHDPTGQQSHSWHRAEEVS